MCWHSICNVQEIELLYGSDFITPSWHHTNLAGHIQHFINPVDRIDCQKGVLKQTRTGVRRGVKYVYIRKCSCYNLIETLQYYYLRNKTYAGTEASKMA